MIQMNLDVLDIMAQTIVSVTSITAGWLLSGNSPKRNLGFAIGLCGQPFWFITLFINGQVVLFPLAAFHTLIWIKGISTHLLPKGTSVVKTI